MNTERRAERELAARLLRESLAAESDYTEEGNARVSADRCSRRVDAIVRAGERRLLVGSPRLFPSLPVYPEPKLGGPRR